MRRYNAKKKRKHSTKTTYRKGLAHCLSTIKRSRLHERHNFPDAVLNIIITFKYKMLQAHLEVNRIEVK